MRKAIFIGKQVTGTYDWSNHSARWTRRREEEPPGSRCRCSDGDMSGLLINLAIIRDAQPGTTLDYRFVDNGRARDHRYAVASDLESVAVDGMSFNAMRVNRVQGNEETVVWVVDGVPTPVRILQRENGEDTFDLRLVDYRGAQ